MQAVACGYKLKGRKMNNWREAEAAYDEVLNDEGYIKITGLEFSMADILKTLDPTAYKIGLFEYVENWGVDPDDLGKYDERR